MAAIIRRYNVDVEESSDSDEPTTAECEKKRVFNRHEGSSEADSETQSHQSAKTTSSYASRGKATFDSFSLVSKKVTLKKDHGGNHTSERATDDLHSSLELPKNVKHLTTARPIKAATSLVHPIISRENLPTLMAESSKKRKNNSRSTAPLEEIVTGVNLSEGDISAPSEPLKKKRKDVRSAAPLKERTHKEEFSTEANASENGLSSLASGPPKVKKHSESNVLLGVRTRKEDVPTGDVSTGDVSPEKYLPFLTVPRKEKRENSVGWEVNKAESQVEKASRAEITPQSILSREDLRRLHERAKTNYASAEMSVASAEAALKSAALMRDMLKLTVEEYERNLAL